MVPSVTPVRSRCPPPPLKTSLDRARGFSLLELTVVLLIAMVLLAIAVTVLSGYQDREASRRAAQVFAQDLTFARSSARRGREPVVVHFYEGSRWYSLVTDGGRELVRRRFGPTEDINLTGVDLEMPGDSLRFDARGVADLAGVGDLGSAAFTAGTTTWEVEFNATGASRVQAR